MSYSTGDTSTPRIKKDDQFQVVDPGPYVGTVKVNEDPTRMGTLQVLIPALAQTNEATYSSQLYTVKYAPSFYGAKSYNTLEPNKPADFKATQHSYGMWMVPPDIDTEVLVVFAEGNTTKGFWIGCVQQPYTNHMMPGIAASEQSLREPDANGNSTEGVDSQYGTNKVPVAEANRASFANIGGEDFNKLKKPVHPFAKTLRRQGLGTDDVRGTTTSSARRESPSRVFGVSTPGRLIEDYPQKELGIKTALKKAPVSRSTGQSFTMDDGDDNGQNQLIRLRSASGHQLLLNDSQGVVYLANGDGSVWMEFGKGGIIDIYSELGYNVRSGGDINFHAEGDIKMYANRNIKIKANEDYGTIQLDGNKVRTLAESEIRNQSRRGSILSKAGSSIFSDAAVNQIHQSMGVTHLSASQVHFNSRGRVSNFIPSMTRTDFLNEGGLGTGTLTVDHPDVTPFINAGRSGDRTGKAADPVLKVDRALSGMTGMRVPTHEPFWGHVDKVRPFASSGTKSIATGTIGGIEQSNRNSEMFTIRHKQYEADLERHLVGVGTDQKETETNLFTLKYDTDYGLRAGAPYHTDGEFNDYKKLGKNTSDFYNTTRSSLTVNDASNLNVAVFNDSGILYAKGMDQTVTASVAQSSGSNLSKVEKVTGTVNNILNATNEAQKVVGIIPGTNIVTGSIGNVSKTVEVYKSAVSNTVTAVTQVTSVVNTVGRTVASVAKSIGKVFGF